jgi:hypothetical protein
LLLPGLNFAVITGLDPVIPLRDALNSRTQCLLKRDGRVKPGHDGEFDCVAEKSKPEGSHHFPLRLWLKPKGYLMAQVARRISRALARPMPVLWRFAAQITGAAPNAANLFARQLDRDKARFARGKTRACSVRAQRSCQSRHEEFGQHGCSPKIVCLILFCRKAGGAVQRFAVRIR